MIAQDYPEELDYINAKLHPAAKKEPDPKTGSFLECFLWACLRADHENYELIHGTLLALMAKYPADPVRLAMERHDRGA